MTVTKICPLCDSPNSPSAVHCSCGYTFPRRHGGPIARMWKGIGCVFLGFVVLLGANLDLVDLVDLPISFETLAVGAFAAVIGGIWLFLSGMSRLMRERRSHR